MKTIWKYQFDVTEVQMVTMQQGAQILTVQVQDGIPCIWALVDPLSPWDRRTFRIYSTGQPINDEPGQYIGTFQMVTPVGGLVFHLFEVTPRTKEGVAT